MICDRLRVPVAGRHVCELIYSLFTLLYLLYIDGGSTSTTVRVNFVVRNGATQCNVQI